MNQAGDVATLSLPVPCCWWVGGAGCAGPNMRTIATPAIHGQGTYEMCTRTTRAGGCRLSCGAGSIHSSLSSAGSLHSAECKSRILCFYKIV